jgi:hypothetical protein
MTREVAREVDGALDIGNDMVTRWGFLSSSLSSLGSF